MDPDAHGGGPVRTIDAEGEQLLLAIVGEWPDLTLGEIAERYAAHRGTQPKFPTLQRTLDRLGLTRKKAIFATERESHTTRLLRWHFKRLGSKTSSST